MVRKFPQEVVGKSENYFISEMEMELELAVAFILPLNFT
jgi:hypothetical protein